MVERKTKETDIKVELNLDVRGENKIETGIGFFDHMLNLMAFWGDMTLNVKCVGDLWIDGHHTVEDVGICIGKAIAQAFGDKKGINRYGSARTPMDECLATVDMDISNRPYLVFNADVKDELVQEFFQALAFNAGITLHINLLYGKNEHHKAECIYKTFGFALKQAVKKSSDTIQSTKGMI